MIGGDDDDDLLDDGFDFSVGEEDDNEHEYALDSDEPAPPDIGDEAKTRQEKKRDRQTMREELDALRQEREAWKREQQEQRAELDRLRQGTTTAIRTVAETALSAARGPQKTALDQLYEQQEALNVEYATRTSLPDRPLTTEEYQRFMARDRELQEKIAEQRYLSIQAKHAPNESSQRMARIVEAMNAEFPEMLADRESSAIANAEFSAALARKKPMTEATAREVCQKVAIERGFAKPPPPSKSEKRTAMSTRSEGNGSGNKPKTMSVPPGTPQYEMALRHTAGMSDTHTIRQRIQHWVNMRNKASRAEEEG